jgi:hypothetical protein
MKEPLTQKIAIIGAGPSGLAALKNLKAAGFRAITCYEQQDRVGGNWVFTSGEGHSSVCSTTHIISSKTRSAFPDFPMPDDYPDYPSHGQVLAYFEDYATHFDLYPFIRFGVRVRMARPGASRGWVLQLEGKEEEQVDTLIVANGHHAVPSHPEWRDQFEGAYMHAHAFKNNQGFEGKRVLVVGAGNSGCDCAVEISRVAAFTAISVRTPQYIVPKFFMGKPTDVFDRGLRWVPGFMREPLRRWALRFQIGRYEDYGLQTPVHGITEAHPTVNSELLYKIRHGKVHPRRAIVSIHGHTVQFADGLSESFDAIVAATGYEIATPFIPRDILDFSDTDAIPLYLRMFYPGQPDLIFIGMVQPQGAIWPLSDRQARVAAAYLLGQWSLPLDLAGAARREAEEIRQSFLPRRRHLLEVHFDAYADKLDRMLRQLPTPITTLRQQYAKQG